MSDRATLGRIEAATGVIGHDSADAQATRYWPRAYRTRHDDAIAERRRSLAYILGLREE